MREHIAARHATWATRFVTSVVSENSQGAPGLPLIITPHRIDLGSHPLFNIFPNTHPALAILRASHDKPHPGISVPTGNAAKMGPLARLANGLNSMGRICEVAKGGRLPLGPWCQSAPLWANPLLGVLETCGPFAALTSLPGLRTLGDLQRLRHQSDSNNAAINRLWDATPVSWRNTLPSPVCPPADWTSAVATIISRLGWEKGVGTRLPISETTVRSATRMQLGTLRRDRHCHVLQYVTSALQGKTADLARTAAAAANTLLIDMADLWRLPWEQGAAAQGILLAPGLSWNRRRRGPQQPLTSPLHMWLGPPSLGDTRGHGAPPDSSGCLEGACVLGLPHRPGSAQGDQCQPHPYLPASHLQPYLAADAPHCPPWMRAPASRGLEDHSSSSVGGHGVRPQGHARPAAGAPQGPEQPRP